MSEARKQILELLAKGRLSVEEAEKLLDACRKDEAPSSDPSTVIPFVKRTPVRRLRVQIERNREVEFKMNISADTLRTGMRVVDYIPAYVRDAIDEALRARGARFRVQTLQPERADEFIDLLDGAVIDIGAGAEIRFVSEAFG